MAQVQPNIVFPWRALYATIDFMKWVRSVAVTADGAVAVSGGDDGIVRVWDLVNGQQRAKLTGHSGWVRSVAVTADGVTAVTGGNDCSVRLWNLANGQEQAKLTGHTQLVAGVAITADGTTAISGSADRTVRVWDLATRKQQAELTGHTSWVWLVAITADGTTAVSGSMNETTIVVWDLAARRERAWFSGHSGPVHALAITADGTRAVSGYGDTILVWDLTTGRELAKLTDHTHSTSVWSIAVTADGTRAVTGGVNGMVQVWNLATGREQVRLTDDTEDTYRHDDIAADEYENGVDYLDSDRDRDRAERDVPHRWDFHLHRWGSIEDDADLPAAAGPDSAEPPERFLVAQLPARVPLLAEVSLVVRVSVDPSALPASKAVELSELDVGPGGTRVTVVVQTTSDLEPLEALEQVIMAPAAGDSRPVRFAFRARGIGLQRILLTAWAGGTFLAELPLELSVEDGGPYVDSPARVAAAGIARAEPGEVTLQVRFDGERYTFQLLSEDTLFEPVLAEAVTAQPTLAVERMIDTLRTMATGGTKYSASNARAWMERAGIGLWNDMVPEVIKDQFWQLQSNITALSVAAGRDVIPWELLYPVSHGFDEGFLVEQFPVMRRVYGQQRFRSVLLGDARYVVPPRSPATARTEIDSIQRMVTGLTSDAQVIGELDVLLELIESGQAGLLHFACHNTFDVDANGSVINMDGGPFVPLLLNKAVTLRTLADRHPLVFINACRSAGIVPEFTQMMGWASQFMAAGAGAFAGTLWPVRSDTAAKFAEAFYDALRYATPLGEACLDARRECRNDADPTWLAYTVYGDPMARGDVY